MEISSIGEEAGFLSSCESSLLEEKACPIYPSQLSYEKESKTQNSIKQKILSQELQIRHCKQFVALHCNQNTQVMTVLNKAIDSWVKRGLPIDRLLAAVEFAAEKHFLQSCNDATTTPHIMYLMCIAQLTLELGQLEDSDTIIAAILQDTITNTTAQPKEIEQQFGKHVLHLILDLAESKKLSEKISITPQLTHVLQMNEKAKVIQLANCLYNIYDVTSSSWKKTKIENVILKAAKLIQSLRGTNSFLEQAIDKKINAYLAEQYPSKYVGRLAQAWQFPSDHLPVGASIDGIEIVTWNVLNTAYMSWVIEKDSQGLKGSLLSDTHYITDVSTGLTHRDQLVVEKVTEMIHHPTHPKQLISLQECGPAFLHALKEAIPDYSAFNLNFYCVQTSKKV